MRYYIVNFRDIVYSLWTWFLRSTELIEYIYSFVKPLKDLNITFYDFTIAKKNFLKFSGQTIYLQKYLNLIFYPGADVITVTNTVAAQWTYLYNKVESGVDTYIYNKIESSYVPTYIYNRGENTNQFDFRIDVPWYVSFTPIYMAKLVDQFRLAGKRYAIYHDGILKYNN